MVLSNFTMVFVDTLVKLWYNRDMMKRITELFQAAVVAVVMFSPLFYYILFQMEP